MGNYCLKGIQKGSLLCQSAFKNIKNVQHSVVHFIKWPHFPHVCPGIFKESKSNTTLRVNGNSLCELVLSVLHCCTFSSTD